MKAIVGCLFDPILHVMIIAAVLAVLAIRDRREPAETASAFYAEPSVFETLLYGDESGCAPTCRPSLR